MAQATAFFPDLKGKLGFGLMRLPMVGDEVDLAQTEQMVDAYMAAGFHYFDTAHGYISGQSETAARHALTRRYPRDSSRAASSRRKTTSCRCSKRSWTPAASTISTSICCTRSARATIRSLKTAAPLNSFSR